MAAWYVYSGAAGAATGADWANAFTTLAAALSAGAAGDTYYVAQNHAETQASALTLTFKGTAAAWDKVLCVNQAGSVPPVSADLRTTATITTTGNNALTLGGGTQCYYIYGVAFSVGSGAVGAIMTTAGTVAYLKNCVQAKAGTSGTGGALTLSATGVVFDGTSVSFGATNDSLRVNSANFTWKNTAAPLGGAIVPSGLISNANIAAIVLDGLDLSALGSGKAIISGTSVGMHASLINCKLGASVTVAGTPTIPRSASTDLLISNSSSGNSRMERYAYEGTLTTETTIVLTTGAATDGTTPISWKLVTTANSQWLNPFEAFTYSEWIDTLAATTRTFEIVNDGTTLTNADLWCDVEYLGNGSFPISSLATTGTADVLATGANIATSTAVWTTTGIASPVTQKIAVTFTPAMKGFYRLVFKQAKASKTVYVNPRPNEA